MKLTIQNKTEFLNDYYFQTLCLLYFPGEKFHDGYESPASATFLLERQADGFYCRTELTLGERTAIGTFHTAEYIPHVEMTDSDFAALSLGKAYLRAGESLMGFPLPWGYLLGLRPVKRAKFYLDRGYDPQTVEKLFVEDYDVLPSKARLAVETAMTENVMLTDIGETDCGLGRRALSARGRNVRRRRRGVSRQVRQGRVHHKRQEVRQDGRITVAQRENGGA
jgi:hypothetical protein